jgi:hypothetical protein
MPQEQRMIFIELLEEGIVCWRPVAAQRLSEDTYRIVDQVPEGEIWRFQPGEVVRCEERAFNDETGLTAFESLSVK